MPAAHSIKVVFASPAEACSVKVHSKSQDCVPTLPRLVYKLVSL